MQILYIGYWGAHEGLSQSTIYPNLRELARRENVDGIHYVSIERPSRPVDHPLNPPRHRTRQRKGETNAEPDGENALQQSGSPFWGSGGRRELHIHPKVQHHPVFSPRGLPHLLIKWLDFRRVRREVRRICRANKIGLVICRTSLAGYFGIYARRRFSLPLVVESFEPHSDYMVDSGAWKRDGIKHRFQRRLEKQIIEYAMVVSPVSVNHRNKLIADGMNAARVFAVPCYVFPGVFHFDEEKRRNIRSQLGVPGSAIVGIYTGKFGDIYYDQEAFTVFAEAEKYFNDFFLIVLSPENAQSIRSRLSTVGFPVEKAHIDFVKHEDVPAYLSAADFAFSTIRPTPSRRFCSPVKDGEYWAAGLPILIPDDVGDDSQIVKDERAGAMLDLNDLHSGFEAIKELVTEPGIRERMMDIAKRHRGFERQVEVYDRVMVMLGVSPAPPNPKGATHAPGLPQPLKGRATHLVSPNPKGANHTRHPLP